MMTRTGTSLLALTAGLVIATATGQACAVDPPSDPAGNWTFTLDFPDLGGFGEFKLECLLKITVEGDKVKGKIGATSGEGIVDVLDGKYADQEVSFRVVDPQGIPSWYKGKLEDNDTIKGKFKVDVEGLGALELDWNAKRLKDKAPW